MKPIENVFTKSLDTTSWKREFSRDSARVLRQIKSVRKEFGQGVALSYPPVKRPSVKRWSLKSPTTYATT